MKSRVARPVCKKGMNTTPSLHVFTSDYAGCDSGDVIDGVGARFGNNGIRFMNFIHESQSLNREDTKELCAFYLKQGLMTQETIDKMPNKMGVKGTHALSGFMCLNGGVWSRGRENHSRIFWRCRVKRK